MWVKYLTKNRISNQVYYALEDSIKKRNSIVVDPRKLFEFNQPDLVFTYNSSVKLQRRCDDVDNNVPPVPVEDWDELVFIDFKLFKCSLDREKKICANVLLHRFLTNKQPLKILHISLDNLGQGAFMLLSSLPDYLSVNGKVYIEINDRTDSIQNISQARKLINFPCFKSNPNILTVEYFKTKIGYNRGYSLMISEPDTKPFYFWDV
jgi:hypothetical protein